MAYTSGGLEAVLGYEGTTEGTWLVCFWSLHDSLAADEFGDVELSDTVVLMISSTEKFQV